MKRFFITFLSILSIIMVGCFVGCDCGGNPTPPPSPPEPSGPVEKFNLNYLVYTAEINEDFYLEFEDGYDVMLMTWSSSNKSVATVEADGHVMAINEGTAVITAENDDFYAKCTVTVTNDGIVPMIVVAKDDVELYRGDKYAVEPRITYNGNYYYENSFRFNVSEQSLISANSETGEISALSVGNGLITIETEWRGFSLKKVVGVTVSEPIYIQTAKTKVELYSEEVEGYEFNVSERYDIRFIDNDVEQPVEFVVTEKDSDVKGSIARFEDGKFVAIKKGETAFTFTTEYKSEIYRSAEVVVTVKNPIVVLEYQMKITMLEGYAVLPIDDLLKEAGKKKLSGIADENDNAIEIDSDYRVSSEYLKKGNNTVIFYFDDSTVGYSVNVYVFDMSVEIGSLYMQMNGVEYFDGVSRDTEVAGKTAMVKQSVTNNTWVEVYEQIRFAITEEDIDLWTSLGYSFIVTDIYVFNNGNMYADRMYLRFFGSQIPLSHGEWTTVQLPLSVLKENINASFQAYYFAGSGEFVFAMTEIRFTQDYTVNFKDSNDKTLGTTKVSQNGKLNKSLLPSAPAGYEYGWTLNGKAFDLNTPVTEEITLVGTLKIKTVGLKTAYMQMNGTEYFDGKEYNISIGGKIAVLYQAKNVGWAEVYEQLMFDMTAEDIAAWQAMGYNYLDVDFYVNNYGNESAMWVKFYGTDMPVTNGGWNTVKLSLDTIAEKLGGTFQIYYGAYAGNFEFGMATPRLSKGVTVSLEDESGRSLGTTELVNGRVDRNSLPSAPAGYEYEWTLNGTTFDFDTVITEDVVLVCRMVIKTIRLTKVYMQMSGAEYAEYFDGIEYDKVVSGKTAVVYQEKNVGWVEVYEQLMFNVTAADVTFWKNSGYTSIETDIYVHNYGNESAMCVKFYGTDIALINGQWNTVKLPLAALADKVGNQFQVYMGVYAGNFQFGITSPRLSKDYTVSLVDESGSSIGNGSLSDGKVDKNSLPAAPAGFIYSWQYNGADFDFETVITGDITLTAVKKIKSIGLKKMYMQMSGTEYFDGVEYDKTVGGKIATVYQEKNVGWVEVYEQLMFDVTTEDIAAWKAAGYNYIEVDFYVHNYGNTSAMCVKFYGTDIALTNGGWNTVKLSLDTLAANISGQFQIFYGAYAGNFQFGMATPQLAK